MSRIRSTVIAAAALALAATLLPPPAQAAPSGSLTVFATRVEWQQIDLPPNGDTTGDLTIGLMNAARTRGGPVVGSISYNATTVRVNMPGGVQNRMATAWLTMPNGAIQATSLIEAPQGTPATKDQTFIIVGGTGKYVGARGTMALIILGKDERKLVYSFVQ